MPAGHGRRNAPEAPQRSEDENKRNGAAVNIPPPCKAAFAFDGLSAIQKLDGRRRENLSATPISPQGKLEEQAISLRHRSFCFSWNARLRVSQTETKTLPPRVARW
jgi:hypothetical protein